MATKTPEKKALELTEKQYYALFSKISRKDILAAMDEYRKKPHPRFRKAKNWMIVDDEGFEYPHRHVIAYVTDKNALIDPPLIPYNWCHAMDDECQNRLKGWGLDWKYLD